MNLACSDPFCSGYHPGARCGESSKIMTSHLLMSVVTPSISQLKFLDAPARRNYRATASSTRP
jgi:hypothetical protein